MYDKAWNWKYEMKASTYFQWDKVHELSIIYKKQRCNQSKVAKDNDAICKKNNKKGTLTH